MCVFLILAGCLIKRTSSEGFGQATKSLELLLLGPPTAVTVLYVKPAKLVVPPGVVTLTLPDAPVPTTALIVVAFAKVNEDAATPPKLTAVAPVKLVPVIVTDVPLVPLTGVKEVIVGVGGINVNPASEAVPAGAVTTTLPDAPLPTTALIVVVFTTVKDVAATPPKLTAVAPVKFVPVIITVDPIAALVGANELIVA
jgi:hypothetical protein